MTTPNAPTAREAEERDPETVAPGEEFDALVESMIGALQLDGWDAENAREWPFISLPDYANGMANRLSRVEEENASLSAALLAARREVEDARSALREIVQCADHGVDSPSAQGCDYRIVLRQIAALAATQEEK